MEVLIDAFCRWYCWNQSAVGSTQNFFPFSSSTLGGVEKGAVLAVGAQNLAMPWGSPSSLGMPAASCPPHHPEVLTFSNL